MKESQDYLTKQIITYKGNKRKHLPYIEYFIKIIKEHLNKRKLIFFDPFSGSGVICRFMKQHSKYIISNDIEPYTIPISKCYLSNYSTINHKDLHYWWNYIKTHRKSCTTPGFIKELYAPKNDGEITKNDLAYYTNYNAKRIDQYRQLIGLIPHEQIRNLLLGPLLYQATVRANTAGIFSSFFKCDGIGIFGGTYSYTYTRVTKKIILMKPVLSVNECSYMVTNSDANKIAQQLYDIDVVYIDPPYKPCNYSSMYFMLNLITEYKRPTKISKTGIPKDKIQSQYSSRKTYYKSLTNLLDTLCNNGTKHIILSYSNKGFIPIQQLYKALNYYGKISILKKKHMKYFSITTPKKIATDTKLTEYIFLIQVY